jgi:predicted neutral ceramidase superfamily lipid hydrolase
MAVKTFFELVFWLPNLPLLTITNVLHIMNDVMEGILIILGGTANTILQIMTKTVNALPDVVLSLIIYRLATDFMVVLIRGDT